MGDGDPPEHSQGDRAKSRIVLMRPRRSTWVLVASFVLVLVTYFIVRSGTSGDVLPEVTVAAGHTRACAAVRNQCIGSLTAKPCRRMTSPGVWVPIPRGLREHLSGLRDNQVGHIARTDKALWMRIRCNLAITTPPRPWRRRRYHLPLSNLGGPWPSIRTTESSSPSCSHPIEPTSL